jgi:myosin heavy subunit
MSQNSTSITYLAGIVGFSLGSLARFASSWLGRKHLGFGHTNDIDVITDQQHAHLRSELDRLRQELDEKREELASLLREKDGLKEDAKARENYTTETQQELVGARKLLDELTEALEELRTQKRIQDERVQTLSQDIEHVSQELHQEKTHHNDTRAALLDTRTLGSSSFPPHAHSDSLSGDEVVIMLEELNTEILQTAADLADAFDFGIGHAMESENMKEARERATTVVGDRTMSLLRTTAHNEDPTIIQIALQACFVVYCEWIIGTWHQSHSHSDAELLLQSLYESVREGGAIYFHAFYIFNE